MHSGEHVKNMKNMQFGQSLKVRERAHANNPRLNQMSAAVERGAEGGCLVEVGPVPCVD